MSRLTLLLVLAAPAFAQSWYDTTWQFRAPLTISHAHVAGSTNLVNFPVLISHTDPNLRSAQPGGGDILFTAADGLTKLNHEIEAFDASTGRIAAWVQVPLLTASSDTVIYMYYGNPSAPGQQNAAAAWEANYKAVWHLGNGASLSGSDSTSSANHGANTAETAAAGQISGAANLNNGGSSRIVNAAGAGLPVAPATPFTIQGWVNTSAYVSLAVIYGFGSDPSGASAGTKRYLIEYSNHYFLWGDSADWDTGIAFDADSAWHSWAFTWDGSTLVFYRDGVARATRSGWSGLGAGGTVIQAGGHYPTASSPNSLLDEARISAVSRSAGWIATEYANQSSPGTFYSAGAQQPASAAFVATSPNGLTVTVDGVPCLAVTQGSCAYDWTPGSTHTISVSSSAAGAAGTQNIWSSWSDSGAQTHTITAAATSVTYTAIYTTQYYLTSAVQPPAAGSISLPSGWYNSGTVLAISASPNANYTFAGFAGALTGAVAPQNLTVNGPGSVAAYFKSVYACVSAAPGNWSAASTWTSCGGGIPLDGYTATVQHNVVVDRNATVGTSDDGTAIALRISNPGSLTIAGGATLTLHGNLQGTGDLANLVINGGGTLMFDSSKAASPAATHYKYQVTTTYNRGTNAAKLIGNGTLGNGTCTAWAVVTSDPGGGNGYIGDAANGDGGLTQLTCTRLDRLGSPGIRAIESLSDQWTSGPPVADWNHVVLTNIQGNVYLSFGSQGYSLNYVDFWDPGSTGSLSIKTAASTFNAAAREIRHSTIYQLIDLQAAGYTADDSLLFGGFAPFVSWGGLGTQLSNSVVLTNSSAASESYIMPHAGLVSGNYLGSDCSVYDGAGHYTTKTGCDNSHVFMVDQGASVKVTQNIFGSFTASSEDTCGIYAYGTSGPGVVTWTYNLLLPAYDFGNQTGQGMRASCYWNFEGPPVGSIDFEHNTTFGGGQAQGLVSLGEQAAFTAANTITALKSNLFWSTPNFLAQDNNGAQACRNLNKVAYSPASSRCNSAASQPANIVSNTACDYNGGWQIQGTGLAGPGYAVNESAACGTHDVSADPQFVDPTRRFGRWAQFISGSVLPGNNNPDEMDWQAWGIYLLSLRNQPTAAAYNARATIPNLLQWIRAGYTPTNSAYRGTAADGGDIGAVPLAAPQVAHGQAVILQ